MARINTNISSVIAQQNLSRTQGELQTRLERLSTGLRINRGADDPAGLIISERIRSDVSGVNQGIKNSERARSVIATTEASLNEINELLLSVKSLIVESANTGGQSEDERRANQLQIDSAIDSITRISNTASFGGLRLLNGSLDYRLSGMPTSAISVAQVTNASFVGNASLSVQVDVIASAQRGGLYYNGGTTPAGVTLSALTLELAGSRGVQVITVPSGQSLATLRDSVNNLTALTGVQARLINNNVNSGIVFETVDYGSNSFVSVRRLQGPITGDSFTLRKFDNNAPLANPAPFDWADVNLVQATRDTGADVSALVNGNLGTGGGLNLSINSGALSAKLLLTESAAIRPAATAQSFSITGGGALFQLGQDVTALQQTNIGIQSVAASNLGGVVNSSGIVEFLNSLKSGQANSLATNVSRNDFTNANDILDKAIDDVTILRGRLGAFEKNILDTNVRSLQSAFENLTASNSQIRDADFAAETSLLTRSQILASSGTSILGLANQTSQQVLQLLQG
jgi:flagellin